MCGITGFLSASCRESEESGQRLLRAMAEAVIHRGPDSAGYWADPAAGAFLAHRRLAILELSPAGAQPMLSSSERYVLSFNGEIYNHVALRQRLESAAALSGAWRGHSDTETIVAGFDAWGIERTLTHLVGMFALAVWDRVDQTLTLARDRLGEKPLYYGWQGTGDSAVFLFGSELSALRRHPACTGDVNRRALTDLLRHNYVGTQQSIYEGLFRLAPGHLLRVSASGPAEAPRPWWSPWEAVHRGREQPFRGTPEEAVEALDLLLRDSVGQQMVADVPVGAFLSGGIDSSTIVSLMQQTASTRVRTFTIGFWDARYNEAEYAKAVARHLGTEHIELYVTPEDALAVIPRLPSLFSEPFADASQIPTFLVSALARKSVTVSLSGDGGDELFAGYTRYRVAAHLWGQVSAIPIPLRRLGSRLLGALPLSLFDHLEGHLPYAQLRDKVPKAMRLLQSKNLSQLHRFLTSQWEDPARVVLGGHEGGLMNVDLQGFGQLEDVERMMAHDLTSYLPDDILVKVDRAAMGVSLETRVPFLDHRVVEFAWSLPLAYKLRAGVTKWPLRRLLNRYVPTPLMERPKMGFAVPIDAWLRGPLRDWAETLLSESRLRADGFFDPRPIRTHWAEHLSGRRNWQSQLWGILMFQAWHEQNHG